MNQRRIVAMAGLLAAGCLAAGRPRPAQADVKYTQEMRVPGIPGAGNGPLNSTTTYIKKDARRVETTAAMGPVQMQTVELTLCDKQQRYRIDPASKVYTVAKLDTLPAPGAPPAPEAPAAPETPGTGKVIITATVQDLGEETVADRKTHHYKLNLRTQTSGCPGQSDSTNEMEVWVAPDIAVSMACEQGRLPELPHRPYRPTCKVTTEQHGDVAALAKVFSGLVMRMKVNNGDKAIMEQTVTSLSDAALDDALFTVPADYRQVSEQEFAQAQSRAMMQAIMRSQGAGGIQIPPQF